ncbi:hypothetical protein ACH4VM_38890 [Streptomyces sp. NPDC020792]|uniref:hypothetical protein n=1 Tax=Streptomyces sp. NPDC020792 TaxID=3365089 RepID=UPI0037982D1C
MDKVMRAPEPATLLWTTIRMLWLLKDGPPVVMLGDQALTRVPLPCTDDVAALATFAVLSGTTVRAKPVSAPTTVSQDLRRGRRPAATLPLLVGDIVELHSSSSSAAGWAHRLWLRCCGGAGGGITKGLDLTVTISAATPLPQGVVTRAGRPSGHV